MNFRTIVSLLVVTLLSPARPSLALEKTDLLFYLPFENSLTPAIFQGSPEIKLTDFSFPFQGSFQTTANASFYDAEAGKENDNGMTFLPGRRGLGLRVTENVNRSKVYSYPCAQFLAGESFSRREGTLSVWVKPIGWNSKESNHRYFIALTSDNCVIRFYIYGFNTSAWVDGPDKYVLVGGGKWQGWQDDTWTFLAFTYKPGQQCFYINGQLMSAMTDGLVEPEFSQTGIVEISEGSQVVDELMIFGRILTEKEIKAIYKANIP
jgi:hypothetical protein